MSVSKYLSVIGAIYLLFFTSAGPNPMRAGEKQEEETKVLYKAKCASCHGLDGSATTAVGKKLKAKDLRLPETQKLSDEKLFQTIAKGRDKMHAFVRSLGDDKCHQLVAYIRGLAKKE